MKYFISMVFVMVCTLLGRSQSDSVTIEKIDFTGLKKTKYSLALRELSLNPGDKVLVKNLQVALKLAEYRLNRSDLFSLVKINITNWDTEKNTLNLSVEVIENLYLILVPDVDLADRNFNVWWVDQKRSLDRINIGGRIGWKNFSGNKDILSFQTLFGYTQKFGAKYEYPYLNPAKTIGFSAEAFFSRNKEINYATIQDKQAFFKADNKYLVTRQRYLIGLSYRPEFLTQQNLQIGYQVNKVPSDIVDSFDGQFLDLPVQNFLSINYSLVYDKRNTTHYATSGYFVKFQFQKDGILSSDNYSNTFVLTTLAGFIPLSKRWSIEQGIQARLNLESGKRPYFNYSALGYQDEYLRGYEYYVIDGDHYFLSTSSLRFLLFDKVFQYKKWMMPVPKMRRMPYRIYLSANLDQGYVQNIYYTHSNRLPNSWVVGGGFGIDFVLYYDKLISIEWSRNKFGQNGLFLHYKLNLK